jgi:tetratricopeptide (TPR) repeat protein
MSRLSESPEYVENVPPDLPAQIIQRAEGNPLYIEEFLRMLFDNGVFQRDPNKDGWRVNIFQYRMMEGELPSGLLDVFQARLDDLLGTARRVVQVASVIGQTFWETSVNSIVNIDAKALLDNLIARGIITAKPESRFGADREYQFRNALYHEVAYTMLPRANRMSYHQQAAEWLSARVSAHPEMLGTLAAHYAAADRQIEALKTYLEAAKYHLDVALFAETLKLVAAGLGTAREVPRENALPIVSHLWLIQSRALYATRRYSEATAASSTALMLMEELSTEVLVNERIQAAITLGKAYTSMGNYQQALEVLTQGHQIVSRLTNPTVTAALLRAFGLLFWSMGNLDKAQVYEQQALIAAEDSNDERELASVCSMLARIALDKGRLASALDYLEHVLYINMQQEHILYQIMDLRLIAMVYRNLFAYAESIQTIETAKDLACQINFEDLMLEGSLAISLVGMGQVDVGLARIRAVTANDFLNTYDNLAVQLGLVRALALAGHDDECLRYAPTFFEYARPHNPILYGRGLLWFGLVKWRQKQPDALETLRQALASETMYGGRDLWLCHYALYLADPDATVATQHRQAAEALIQALADSLTSHPSLAAQVTLTNAQRLLAMWWQLPPQHTQP